MLAAEPGELSVSDSQYALTEDSLDTLVVRVGGECDVCCV